MPTHEIMGKDLNRQAPPRLFESLGLSPIPLNEIGHHDDPPRQAWK